MRFRTRAQEQMPPMPELPQDDVAAVESVTRLHGTNLVETALHDLETRPTVENAWPTVAVLTTNRQVEDRQIRVVDQRGDEKQPKLRLMMKLHNWPEIYEKIGQAPHEDTKYAFETKGAQHNAWVAGTGKMAARRTKVGSADVALVHSNYLSTDGLVEVAIPYGADGSSTGAAAEIDKVLTALTGEKLWEDSKAKDSFLEWKMNKYRDYFKLGEGPLAPGQMEEAAALHIEQPAPDHIALKAPGLHDRFSFDYEWAKGDKIVPKHVVKGVDEALSVIAQGELIGAERRLERGMQYTGQSMSADMLYGGGDVVYTYARAASEARKTAGSAISFVMKPEILDRIDVRAYDTDAYGSKENKVQSRLDTVLDREKGAVFYGYEDRLAPDEFGKLGQVSELDFEGSISLAECDVLLLDARADKGSFTDTNWYNALLPFVESGLSDTARTTRILGWEKDIQASWGTPESAAPVLKTIGFSDEKISQLTTGMNLPLKERIIAKLQARGINEINGKPVEDFVVYGE